MEIILFTIKTDFDVVKTDFDVEMYIDGSTNQIYSDDEGLYMHTFENIDSNHIVRIEFV